MGVMGMQARALTRRQTDPLALSADWVSVVTHALQPASIDVWIKDIKPLAGTRLAASTQLRLPEHPTTFIQVISVPFHAERNGTMFCGRDSF